MRLLQCIFYNNKCYKKGETIKPTRIVVHSTGCYNTTLKRYVQPHSTQNSGMKELIPTKKTYTRDQMMTLLGDNQYNNDWNQDNLSVCVHAFIGKLADGSIATVQTLPWDMRCWGVGGGSKGSFNDCAIQFEICEDNHTSESYCKQTYKEAVELCAMLCKEYDIDPDMIVGHYEAHAMGYGSNHGDPKFWWSKFGLSMDGFRSDVKKAIGVVKTEEDKLDTSKVDTSAADPKYMWNYFKSKGLNDYGVAGLMGNLYAESSLRACNLQNTYERSLGMTDAEYTVAVDTGKYDNFVNDKAGYGLAQWTFWSLKRDMLDYFKKKNKSIGDLDTQMEFLVHQLSTSYKSVWNTLQNATSVLEASNAVLLNFERPADQSEAMQNKRAGFGQKYFDAYSTKPTYNPDGDATHTPSNGLSVGDIVSLSSGAKYTNGKAVPDFVIKRKIYVRELRGNDVVISILKTGAITGVVSQQYIIKDGQSVSTSKPVVSPTTNTKLAIGDEVQLVSGAKYTSGKLVPNWVLKRKIYVRGISGDNITISILKIGAITGVVNKKYLTKNGQSVSTGTTSASTTTKKSVTEIAKEVILGKWGSGAIRQKKLEEAGYNYNEVQAEVNRLL